MPDLPESVTSVQLWSKRKRGAWELVDEQPPGALLRWEADSADVEAGEVTFGAVLLDGRLPAFGPRRWWTEVADDSRVVVTSGACEATEERCGGECADLTTDRENCGRCGVACGEAESCVAGECIAVPAGYVRIEAGEFTMGSPANELGRQDNETQHRVTITRAFALKATEVTQAEWRAVMDTGGSYFANCGGNCPVTEVSWFDAVDYVNRLSDADGLARCYADDAGRTFAGLDCAGYRLPTEAEWEYAARAGTVTAFHTGDITQDGCDDPNLDAAGWYCGNAANTTHPVGEKQPNAWGLYDMHGNVWEWVHDWYAPYPAGDVVDPLGPAAGDYRVYRGGSWGNGALYARAAVRYWSSPDVWHNNVGFRPARSLP